MFKRIFLIVLDSVGIGELPDANLYGDNGSNTLGNIAKKQNGLCLPTLESMGLGLIAEIEGVNSGVVPLASYGKMTEISVGKDTTSGHWEIGGCPLKESFPVYPEGFPPVLIERFTALTGYEVLGNVVASGTEIIARLGEEHIKSGKPIIYTSADSVFQIAAHEDVIPLPKLYELCQMTREKVCVDEYAVGRVIARPFVGENGKFTRTPNRHDYSLLPPEKTILDNLKNGGFDVIGIGKIGDIFAQQGLTKSTATKSNQHGVELIKEALQNLDLHGLVMANLVEFDSSFGHRNDVAGYAKALREFDDALPEILALLTKDDLLLITADHGCDPTTPSTDHSREYVPLLVYAKAFAGQNLGVRKTFADIAATIADNFNIPKMKYGTSFLSIYRR